MNNELSSCSLFSRIRVLESNAAGSGKQHLSGALLHTNSIVKDLLDEGVHDMGIGYLAEMLISIEHSGCDGIASFPQQQQCPCKICSRLVTSISTLQAEPHRSTDLSCS